MSFPLSEGDPDLSKWKVADLKKELKLRGLGTEGKKNDLVLRLQLAMGDSALLDDAPNDDIFNEEEDVLSDEEALDDSDLVKPDLTEKKTEVQKPDLKRKASESDSNKQTPKKIVLNRNIVLNKELTHTVEEKENSEKAESLTVEKVKVKLDDVDAKERLEKRAAKFGVTMSNEAKKEARAARFGLPTASSKVGGLVNTNIDVLKKRAERFGTTLPGSMLEKAELDERRKKREERFGKVEKSIITAPQAKGNGSSTPAMTIQEKKRLRAQRFKINS